MKTGTNRQRPRGSRNATDSHLPLPITWSPAQIRAHSCNSRRPLLPWSRSVDQRGVKCRTAAVHLSFFDRIWLNPTKSDLKNISFCESPLTGHQFSSPARLRQSSLPTTPSCSCKLLSINCGRARSCQIVVPGNAPRSSSLTCATPRVPLPSPAEFNLIFSWRI
jgi:hypothetical protein